jgi:hypothetical protein
MQVAKCVEIGLPEVILVAASFVVLVEARLPCSWGLSFLHALFAQLEILNTGSINLCICRYCFLH